MIALLSAATLQACGSGSGSCENCGDAPPPVVEAEIIGVDWHLGSPVSDLLSYSASAGPASANLYLTVRRSDGSGVPVRAVGNCSTPQYCEFTPGDLLGIGPPVAYQIRLKGDINAAHLTGNNLLPGAQQWYIVFHVDQGGEPPFHPILEITREGAVPVVWNISIAR